MAEFLYGFDSSLSHFGYCVAESVPWTNVVTGVSWGRRTLRFIVAGVLITKPVKWTGPKSKAPTKTADHQRRFEQLATDLRGVIARHGKPSLIAVEAVAIPRGKTGLVTVSALGRARGLVDGIAAEHAVSVREFFSMTLKRVVTGDKSAEKPAVIAAVTRLYPELEALFAQLHPDNVEHAADAVAALHVALTQEQHHAEANEEA